jgi:basic membrane protein A
MKKTKLLAILLSFVMIFTMAAACSDPNAAPAKTEAKEAEKTEAPGEETPAKEAEETPAPEEKEEEAKEEPAKEAEDAAAKDGSKLKVSWICESILTDGGWNEDGFAEINRLKDEYGFEFSYQEDVSGTDVADVLRNYAASGYDLVLSNEQFHAEDMAAIAPEFPDVTFGCVNGYVSADNMIAITGDMWQHIYLAGVISGGVTKTNKIGLITYSTDSASARIMLAAYSEGAKHVNPDCEVIHVATGSFSDLALGKEMSISLMNQDCDVILCNSGDTNETVMEECIKNKVYTVSAIVDRNHMSDEYVLGSAILLPSNVLRIMVNGFIDGTITGSSEVQVMGLKEGLEEFRVNPDIKDKIDSAILDAVAQAEKDIIDGKIVVELPES